MHPECAGGATGIRQMTTVRVETCSVEGDVDVRYVDVATPAAGMDLADWFDQVVLPLTDSGEGPAATAANGVTASATVVCSDRQDIVHEASEWG